MKFFRRCDVKTPTILQMEVAECGAASLGMVLGYYGKYVTLEELRQVCGVNRDGSKASNIIKAGNKYNLEGGGFAYKPEAIKAIKGPLILHWEFNHFLVYEGYDAKEDIVYLNDPAQGHRKVSWTEFEESFTGVAIVLRPNEAFEKGGEPVAVWKKLYAKILRQKKTAGFILLVGFLMAIVNLYVPILSQIFFDEILTLENRSWLFEVLLGFAIAFVLRLSLTFLRGWGLLRWQNEMTLRDTAGFFYHVLHLPLDFFQQRYTGEISSRVQLNELAVNFLTGKLATTVLDVGIALFYLILLIIYNVELALIGLSFTVINLIVMYYSYQWMTEQQCKIQQEYGSLYGLSVAGITIMESLKANGNENDFFVKWSNKYNKYLSLSQRTEYVTRYIVALPLFLSAINASLVMAVGGFEIMDGFMSVGAFIAFQSLMANFQEPVEKLVSIVQEIQTVQSQLMKIEDVLRYPEEKDTEGVRQIARLEGDFVMEKVEFDYGGTGKSFLKRVNINIPAGRRLAIVGRSGCGKSTVGKLACGLLKAWSGSITYDGIPIEKISKETLAASISVVEQEVILFEGTIAENIALFNPLISRADIVKAAQDACIHEDILQLPQAYDAYVSEGGSNLSGGQRQRIEIARALATNPSFLIFDEATNELDPITEKLVMQNVRRRGCACLLIAHRLSTIRDCDEIVVMEKGRVKERGTHEELMEKGGIYHELLAQNA